MNPVLKNDIAGEASSKGAMSFSSNRMKILYGITKSNFGGAQCYVFDLACEARKAGHDVAVLCGGNGTLVKELEKNGIRAILLPHLKRDISIIDELKSFHFIFRTLVEEAPDVFHTNSSKMGGLGNLAARIVNLYSKLQAKSYKLKIIFTAHGWAFNETWRPLWQKLAVKFGSWLIILLSHKTLCVSEKTRDQIASWPFSQNKLAVIKNGIEPFETLPRPEARQLLGASESTLLVGTLAELHPVKGLDVLLEGWAKFIKDRDAKLIIFGEGDERKNLVELMNIFEIKDSVELKGFVANARQFLTAFDIFVLPSRSENLPYAVLEAGLAGLPVIASRVGGIPEIIETGLSGALIEPENPRELLSTLILLADDKQLMERLGAALKEKIANEFSLEKMAGETFKTYL